jgi:CelD/BcsL family acetyltransferase involved in cellulose biosynthesis
MSTAATIGNPPALHNAAAAPGPRIASVAIVRDLAEAQPHWDAICAEPCIATPYQRFDLVAAWQKHVGAFERCQPFVVVALDGEKRPLALFPLVVQRSLGANVAGFPGGKHTTFNMPIWRRDFALAATRDDLTALIDLVRAQAPDIDMLAFAQQPASWIGVHNPLRLLPSQRSVNDCPLMPIDPAEPPTARISNSFRRRLKGKERKLQALPGYRYTIARSADEVTRTLDGFFAIKPLRMAAQKLPNVFAEPGTEAFIREACAVGLAEGRPAIEIHALECDEELIAIFAGVADGARFSMMFNTYTLSDNARYSPGLILMRNIIDHYAAAGYGSLDLGIGTDEYKLLFCKEYEPIFDSFLPLTHRGQVAAAALAAIARAKRAVKQTPALMRIAQTVRATLGR